MPSRTPTCSPPPPPSVDSGGPDARFGCLDGVVRTRVGYAGGTTPDPTYHRPGGHTETIEIDYDADVVSYEDLLAVFWASHDPRTPAYSRQYRSAIFVHDDESVAGELRAVARPRARSSTRPPPHV